VAADHIGTCEESAARLLAGAAASTQCVLGIVVGTVLHEVTSRRFRERHVWMDFLRVTHRCLNKLLVSISVEVRAIRCYTFDSPHDSASPFRDC
jgi:hypothetical protein